MPDLLIELFSEEIPARMQARAAEDLKKRMTDALVEAGLTYGGAAGFATPRRLALAVEGVLASSPTTREERKGPRVDASDKAIEGFLRGAGVTRDQLEVRDEKKGQVYYATITRPGRPASEIVAEELEKIIRNFPWPKSMRWGAGSLRWVRPLHSILCILTDEMGEATVVDLEIDGIRAGNTTEGHRFMGHGSFAVTSFDDYRAKLRRDHVMLEARERADHIWQDASNQAFAAGLELVEDAGLLAEVSGLVEWPVVLMGQIDEDFLGLPGEVLQTSMREHQKFFSVKNPKTGQIERFVTVANVETADHGATILAGNQKVLAARLSDAKFFWENDLRLVRDKGLAGMAEGLSGVTFHNKLGSQADRIARIAALAREIAPGVGADPDLAEQAAKVAKADLQSEMVYEFPELQGLMGRYYAEAEGLPPEVAAACQEHYSPLGPSDAVPTGAVSVAVALADKLDTLTGFWATFGFPTGSADPFALRRAALGVVRLIVENNLSIGLYRVLYGGAAKRSVKAADAAGPVANLEFRGMIIAKYRDVLAQFAENPDYAEKKRAFGVIRMKTESFDADYADWAAVSAHNILQLHEIEVVEDLLAFFHDRLKVYLKDQGIRHDVINACIAMPGNDDLTLLVKRAEALSAFLKTDDGENLLQGFKRANNILTQAEEKDGVEYSYGADVKFAETDVEKAIFAALDTAEPEIARALEAEDFAGAMAVMAGLRPAVDAFFDAVQINADNQVLRRNRLNLLSRIRVICLQVADLTRIEG
ncbi:glycyl-tRNA synthetase beta chain [Roseovarius lutimaris]|uniref:Glycine--tRNA ligase beta subunit n=1 Tax=Roseovarius lutimaris TaxID=1005928 RepID=A0A1I5DQ45_9RHOB|nr:glycine--tRNA ligase subunit beta [Roseovarius lutimaris]SFO00901.1 glycyl-tRNA synthetase beta chain [Roseovarius lutimaris]